MPEILKDISKVNLQTRPRDVVFGEVIYPPGGVCGPRTQQDYQLVVIHRGGLDLSLEGREIEVAPGHAILLTPNHREHFIFSRDTETHHSWCSIRSGEVPASTRRLFSSLKAPAPFSAHLATLLAQGMTTSFSPPANENLENCYYLGLGMALLSGFALALKAGGKLHVPGDEALARLENFVSREYGKPLQLPDLAIAAGVSCQHLMKLCREGGRPTPINYLYQKRLEAAADCLSHTGLSIGEIADRCGFANPFHFSRKFRLTYGKSPRSWRAHAWKEG